MAILVFRRLLLSAFVILSVAMLIFVATEVLPGDALEVSLTSDELAMMTSAELDQKRHELGLDRPAPVRFLEWVTKAAHGDFGTTIISHAPVWDVIGYPLRNSTLLAVATVMIAFPLALLLGMTAAYYKGRWPDVVASAGAIIGYSIPEFASGNVLVLCFAIWLPIFPSVILAFTKAPPEVLLKVAFLPVVTIVFASIAHMVRLVRAGFIEALNSDYVERARLNGVGEMRLLFRHALPAAIIPALSSMALYVAGLLHGVIVVEKVFSYPGLGIVLVDAVEKREVAIVQAIGLLATILVIGMNLLADLAIVALDPRARTVRQ
ncbi:MAG: ABC transporter permease [Proteobacteria bacterium]|nr:ABC transporter permease [Pseudomonadota bacterium]